MRIVKRESKFRTDSGSDVILRQNNNKYMEVLFAGNLDLYWCITDQSRELDIHGSDSISLDITKENFELYEVFRDLFTDISDKRVCDSVDSEVYDKYNYANYNELISKDRKTITWYSDDSACEVGSYLVITDNQDSFHVEFHTQAHIEGFDREPKSLHSITIRFRNSGSRYNPFNMAFMDMYHKMQGIEDVHKKGHQIHIEEYMYDVARKRCKGKREK